MELANFLGKAKKKSAWIKTYVRVSLSFALGAGVRPDTRLVSCETRSTAVCSAGDLTDSCSSRRSRALHDDDGVSGVGSAEGLCQKKAK